MNEKCACLKVDYTPILNEDGSRTEQWLCLDCKSIFIRKESAMCEADSNAVLGEVPNITDENIQELREIILDSGSSRNYQNKQIREWVVRHFTQQ